MQLNDVERVASITRPEFVERFVRPGKPVIIGNLADGWPAMKKWTPAYFKERFGERRVMAVTTTKTGTDLVSHYGGHFETSMRELIDAVLERNEDVRLGGRHTLDLALDLIDDFAWPDLGEGYTRRLLWLFFGAKGSRTPLHFDFGPFHVFHTSFLGKKTFHLFDQEQSHALHRKPLTARSHVDTFHPDYDAFPRLKGARGWRATIDRGDTLYMPAGVWHDVTYHDPSIALTLRFTEHAAFVATRVLFRLLLGTFNDVMERVAPKLWPRVRG